MSSQKKNDIREYFKISSNSANVTNERSNENDIESQNIATSTPSAPDVLPLSNPINLSNPTPLTPDLDQKEIPRSPYQPKETGEIPNFTVKYRIL